MSGQGKLAIASERTEVSNNECYIGQFEDDVYDGKLYIIPGYGEYMIHGFVVYKGYWRKGKKHGKGEYRKAREDKFADGVFCDGHLLQLSVDIPAMM